MAEKLSTIPKLLQCSSTRKIGGRVAFRKKYIGTDAATLLSCELNLFDWAQRMASAMADKLSAFPQLLQWSARKSGEHLFVII